MSEIFWIARGEFSGPDFVLQETLTKNGIQPAWMQMIHWIGPGLHPAPPLAGSNAISLAWQPQAGLCAYLLHDTCRSILLRELNLVMLIEREGSGTLHQVVLASPVGVGQHNLFPRAHLAAWWAIPTPRLDSLHLWLERSGYDPEAVGWLAGDQNLVSQACGRFPKGNPLENQPECTAGQLNALVASLSATRSELGLLISATGGPTSLVTLVEL